jgi:4-amino-4-deoxy-L-arabinose transferase-like glycosyltransferase
MPTRSENPAQSAVDSELKQSSTDSVYGAQAAGSRDGLWLLLGYAVIALILVSRLAFIATDRIELSKDEAYQWLWSKHLAASYYSKPPMIAYAQWLGTSLWGDTAFGVRFWSPVIGAVLGLLLLRWFARLAIGRTAFALLLVLQAAPLLAVGTTLLTIDPLLVLFWTIAMIMMWRALEIHGTIWHWLGAGLAIGLAFLSKYSALYFIVCLAIFFGLHPPARPQLRRPGPWLALGIVLVCTGPVLAWNAQHGWITLEHVASNADLHQRWHPTLRHFGSFIGAELGLLNPILLVAALWAMAAYKSWWPAATDKPGNASCQQKSKLMVYLLAMGAPVFLGHALWTIHSGVQPNWIAPAVVPMFCLMVLYWAERLQAGVRAVRPWFVAALTIGFLAAVLLHAPEVVELLTGKPLPPDKDPLRRVRAWRETAKVVGAALTRLEADGAPAFVIVHHYGLTGLLTFYWPEARPSASRMPLVYSLLGAAPENQFYFWPEYRYKNFRRGQNAVFVVELGAPRYSTKAWFDSLLRGSPDPQPFAPTPEKCPQGLQDDFDSVQDLGVTPIYYHGRIYRWLQLFECRRLR